MARPNSNTTPYNVKDILQSNNKMKGNKETTR